MAEFLTTQGTSHNIEDIIIKANKKLVLISPFLQISKTLFERLKDADRQNVKIILIYGKDELKPNERRQLKQLRNLSLYFFENLHAKCFFNEESMVITSMNMYEFSEKTNREMGVLIRANGDEKVYNEAVKEADSILASAKKDSLIRSVVSEVIKEAKTIVDSAIKDEPKRPKGRYSPHKSRTKQTGYCIRCKKHIPLDVEQPLCHDCWEKWNIHNNPDYKEHFCHTCGKPSRTTKARPKCDSCYKQQR